jgi:hypothetical protein
MVTPMIAEGAITFIGFLDSHFRGCKLSVSAATVDLETGVFQFP